MCLTNLNRQIIATYKTIGKYKTDVMKERILDINPKADVRVHKCFFLPENADTFPFEEYDYVADAVDTVTAKIALVMKSQEVGVPIISSMGAGNKVNPAMFEVADIYKTSIDPLARVMRQAMKKHHIKKLKVVYSKELPLLQVDELKAECHAEAPKRRALPGSNAFCPSVAGLIIASEVIKELADWDDSNRKGVAQ